MPHLFWGRRREKERRHRVGKIYKNEKKSCDHQTSENYKGTNERVFFSFLGWRCDICEVSIKLLQDEPA